MKMIGIPGEISKYKLCLHKTNPSYLDSKVQLHLIYDCGADLNEYNLINFDEKYGVDMISSIGWSHWVPELDIDVGKNRQLIIDGVDLL